MYVRPQTRVALARLWDLVAASLTAHGETPPATLSWPGDLNEAWRSPELYLSQTCGLPYRLGLHTRVHLVATPVLIRTAPKSRPEDPPGYYHSAVIARSASKIETPRDLNATRVAYNEAMSQSGWGALATLAEAQSLTFSGFQETGAHVASVRAVRDGQADIAAIDCLTWHMIERWDPELCADLKVVWRTPPTPSLPFITADVARVPVLRRALHKAFNALDETEKSTLGWQGIVEIAKSHYLALPAPKAPK